MGVHGGSRVLVHHGRRRGLLLNFWIRQEWAHDHTACKKAEGKQFVSDICPPIVLLLTMPVFHSLRLVTSIWYALSTSFLAALLKIL